MMLEELKEMLISTEKMIGKHKGNSLFTATLRAVRDNIISAINQMRNNDRTETKSKRQGR